MTIRACKQNFQRQEDLKDCEKLKNKGDGALNFPFLLDQKLRIVSLDSPADDLVVNVYQSKMECFYKFAPEQPIMHNDDSQWITNSIKHALFKRDLLYQKWIDYPCDDYYKKNTKPAGKRPHI